MTRSDWQRLWSWGARLAVLVLLAQACGGDSGKSTGPSGATQITVALQSKDLAQIPSNCTGTLTATRPGFAPRSAPIPPDGRVTLLLTPGEWTFTVELRCLKTDGTIQILTGSQTGNVGSGGLSLSFQVAANEAPSAGVVCQSPVNVGQGSGCSCTAADRDPGDVVTIDWSASGGSVSPASGPDTTFSSGSPGVFDVTCTVRDNRGGLRSATTSVTVGVQFVTLSVSLTDISLGGTMTSSPAGISCASPFAGPPGTCSASFPFLTTVTLTKSSGSPNTGWGGACAGVLITSSTCTLTLTGNTTATYDFI